VQIENDFSIGLPPDDAYNLLLDLERVTPCVPGAQLGEEREDGARAVRVTVKLGPIRMTYDGTVRVIDADPEARKATLRAEAREARGQGTASATIAMTVGEAGAGATVHALADVDLTGRAAQNGRGIVQDVSKRMIAQMAAELEARYSAPAAGDAPAATEAAPTPSAAPPAATNGTLPAGATASTPAPRPAAAPTQAPAPAPPPAPIKGGSLLLRVLWDRIKALFTRGSRA
jgi:carbon monoxide dehydrogenase subunit G